jgi:hypothetical protein
MDNWGKQLINWLNDVENGFNLFCEEVNKDWEKSATEVQKLLNDVTEEIEHNLPQEIEDLFVQVDIFIEECITILVEEDPLNLIQFWWDQEQSEIDNEDDNIVWFDVEKTTPNAKLHPACVGCRNYHGYTYNGNLLVCGIHPYGWDDENCPDWEKKDPL